MEYTKYLAKLVKEVSWMHEISGISKCKLFVDYVYSFLRVKCSIRDYESYRFFEKSIKEMKEYLLFADMSLWYSQHNSVEAQSLLNNKEATLKFYKDYVNREWCGTNENNSVECYQRFTSAHNSFIIKPLSCSGGVEYVFHH